LLDVLALNHRQMLPLLWTAIEKRPDDVTCHRTACDCAEQGKLAADLLRRYQALAKTHRDSAVVQN
jgi:hypothetical protein